MATFARTGRPCSFYAAALMAGLMLFLPPSLAAQDTGKYHPPPNVIEGRQLVQALQAGGYIIYLRHGITDLSRDDVDRRDLASCATQRPLSDEGRQQMREIGRAIEELGIRISTVLSSPFCRTSESAKLAFGRVEIVDDLRQDVDANEDTAKRRALALQKMLATMPSEPDTNTVLAGHTGNLLEATGIWPKPEGVAIVFKPHADGKFTYVATIPPLHWQRFVRGEYESSQSVADK